jgi:hypothetical protein
MLAGVLFSQKRENWMLNTHGPTICGAPLTQGQDSGTGLYDR